MSDVNLLWLLVGAAGMLAIDRVAERRFVFAALYSALAALGIAAATGATP